ncbi:MAG: histidine kinase, partial [Odoribacter sp.]|nr:histidine kinase [Odoribacter sp.]
MQSEVKNLKQQATPELLFSSLHTAGELAEKKPEKAVDIIMNLSTVLRYQLYEGDKKQVLLKTETEYIKNYLHLIRLISENNFVYKIKTDAKLNFVFIPPLLYM